MDREALIARLYDACEAWNANRVYGRLCDGDVRPKCNVCQGADALVSDAKLLAELKRLCEKPYPGFDAHVLEVAAQLWAEREKAVANCTALRQGGSLLDELLCKLNAIRAIFGWNEISCAAEGEMTQRSVDETPKGQRFEKPR